MEQQLPETLGSAVAGAKELSTTYADDEKLNRGDDVHVHSAPNSVVSYGPQTQESGRGTDQQVPAGLGLGAEGSCVRVNGTSSGLAPPSAAAGAGLDAPPVYRLYKARFSGAVGVIALSLVTGMCQPWFGPIANDAADAFVISLDQVNWLGNIISVMYLVFAPVVPIFCRRYGIRVCYMIGTVFLIASAWVRYAGTIRSLSSGGAYALLIIGQILSAVPQAAFQVLAPKFSETWFDLQGRTTATMIMSISNPVGTAIGQLIPPLVGNVRNSVLVLGIVCTAVSPFVFLIGSKPPTPPSYSGSQPTVSVFTTLRAIVGILPRHAGVSSEQTTSNPPSLPFNATLRADEECAMQPSPASMTSGKNSDWKAASSEEEKRNELSQEPNPVVPYAYMTLRERIDFMILFLLFGVLFAGINTFAVLSDQILEPYGYSNDTAGFMGAALLLAGLLAACVTSPLFDRVFTHHLGLAARILVPPIGAAWLALIWAVRPNNTAALYALFVIIGVCSLSVLPVGLELGCELTRNSAASASILWWSGNLFGIIFVLVMSALRAPDSASPPQNMHRALIFSGVTVFTLAMSVFVFRGHQRRREMDARQAEMNRESRST